MIRRVLCLAAVLVVALPILEIVPSSLIPIKHVECAAACANPPALVVNGVPVTWGAVKSLSVYTDLQGSERTDVQNAIAEWNANGGSPQMTLTPSTQTDPGQGAPGYIRFVNGTTQDNIADQPAPTTAIITQVTITFNRNFQIPAPGGGMINEYTPTLNNGDTFLTNLAAHELGHALGLDDFRDASGAPTDAPAPSAMGADTGNNNNGWPTSAGSQAAPPGNMAGVTPCDKNQVASDEAAAAAKSSSIGGSSKGNPPVPVDGNPGSGTGGSEPVTTCYSYSYWEGDKYIANTVCVTS